MSDHGSLVVAEDFDFLVTLLPDGWDAKAKELGALRRCRKIPDAGTLLRILLIHLAEGCSLRETAVRARQGGIADVSDVAIMDRLRCAGEWFRWLNTELMSRWVSEAPVSGQADARRMRIVDATQVNEPGQTGSSWRLHYSVELPSLRCNEVLITGTRGHGTGETFAQFNVDNGDLLVGDRAYGAPPGIAYVVQNGGHVLVRFTWSNLPLWTASGARFDLFGHLRTLSGTALGDWPVYVEHNGEMIPGRVCAARRSRQAAEKAQRQARRKAQKNGRQIAAETLEAAKYFAIFTTLPRQALRPRKALHFYRGRWQVELVFKRLKSIVGLGHLRKRDDEASRAWIQGKLFVAFLLETMLRYADSFSPWGYPLHAPQAQPHSLPVARGELHAPPA